MTRDQFNGHIHRGVGRRLISGCVRGDDFLIGLGLVVLEHASNAFLVQGFMRFYNFERPHHGYRVRERGPASITFGTKAVAR